MATIKDIAERAGVSTTTVSRVLSQDDTMVVSNEVRMRVFRIAHELKYVSPQMQRRQSKNKLVVGIADWHIVYRENFEVGQQLLDYIIDTGVFNQNIEFARMEKDKFVRYDGIIALGSFSKEELEKLESQAIAVVLINSDNQDYRFDSIVMDFDKGVRDAIQYLVCEREYRSIGYIGGLYTDGDIRIGYRRLANAKELFAEYGLLVEQNIYIGEFTKESGYSLAKKAIDSGCLPEAFLLGSDAIAEGAVQAFKEANIRIPKDVAVVVFEDIRKSETSWSGYTKVQMYPNLVWETAVKLLLEQIRGKRTDTMKIFLPGKLEQGSSA